MGMEEGSVTGQITQGIWNGVGAVIIEGFDLSLRRLDSLGTVGFQHDAVRGQN